MPWITESIGKAKLWMSLCEQSGYYYYYYYDDDDDVDDDEN